MQVAEAQNVLMFSPVSELKQGRSGVLIVSNFKLSFVTTEEYAKDVSFPLKLFYLFIHFKGTPIIQKYTLLFEQAQDGLQNT